jgi:hypothetical protein
MIASNLTFGTGGKDKAGNNIAGWGYYEVIDWPVCGPRTKLTVAIDDRWRFWSGADMARHRRRPHAYH